ncbi:MAG: terminase family protein [Candidatus Bathyarchaeia archaeon]
MQSFRKKPRTMRPNQILPKWFSLQQSKKIVDEAEVAKAQKLSNNPIEFFRQIVGFEPTPYQKEFTKLFLENQFLAARWCRQSGKSWIVSALLLWYAITHPDNYIGVVAPSWRQAKFVIRRIAHFVRNLPPGMAFKPLKTVIRLTNGSVIEAFPCNPDTIRGPTLDVIYADEFSFMPNDEEMYDAILFTISTKSHGKFVCTSTPWSTNSVFYKIFHCKGFEDFAKHHVTWEQALEPNGPLKKSVLEKIRKQFADDSWRWRREMEAEWAEDESVWLPQALITNCIDSQLEYYGFEEAVTGVFYAGLDLGKHRDYSVLAIVQTENSTLKLVHMRRFPLHTPYASVIGYVKALCDRWQTINKVLVDMTGVGDYIAEDMVNAGINQTEGVKFTMETKEQMAQWLKQCMADKRLKIPYDSELIAELNTERFELTKEGKIRFSHPENTHDDRFWSLALAVYATREKPEPPSKLWVVPRLARLKKKLQRLRKNC